MGFLKGAKFHYSTDGNKEGQFTFAWGTLVEDATVQTYKSKRHDGEEKIKTSCTIKTFTKNYLNCVSWGDNDVSRLIAPLEKGDAVCVAGTETTYEYTNRNGEKKVVHDLNVEFVVPQGLIVHLLRMAGNKGIAEIIEANELEDTFESDDDYLEVPAPEEAQNIVQGRAEFENDTEWDTDIDESEMPFK